MQIVIVKMMSREKVTQSIVKGLAKHPYLWSFVLCILIHPFFFGETENIPNNALWLETLMIIGIITAFGIYKYKSGDFSKFRLILFEVSAITADWLSVNLYSQSQNKAIWHFAGGCVILFILYYFADFKKYRTQLNALLIIGLGFFLKLCYILSTSVYTRQHDVDTFGGDYGHAGYIEYLLFNRRLPDFDVRERWQFCHPPLHHIISAVWIDINENILLTGHDSARESLQTLTLFYSLCIIISAYKLFRHFQLDGTALYVPLMIVSFHSSFILFSGSINNDVLSVAFMMGAIVSTLEWYEKQTMKGILKIALCTGLGMMTKISAAMVALPVALVFLCIFIKNIKTDWKKLIGQFVCFGIVCIPLGLWFGIRNYIKWKVPITYVQEMDKGDLQYIGDQSFLGRITDFSTQQFNSPYEQFAYFDEIGNVQGYNEYNPLIALMKNALFGEYINESNFETVPYMNTVSVIFFWLNAAIASFALISMIMMCFKKCSAKLTEKLFLTSFYVVMMVSFYKTAADYPFTCTMNFRYITPTVVVGAVFIGLIIKTERKNKFFHKLIKAILEVCTMLFAVCSELVYLTICYKFI